MEAFLPFLIALLATAGMIVVVYLFLKKSGEREIRLLNLEMKKERQDHFLPSKIEAYQRAILLLERISPSNLVMRLHNPGLPAKAMQSKFLESIREEYDHNVAQQIFITTRAWEMVKDSKEECIKIINIAGQNLPETATGMDLSGKILELVAEIGELPTDIAIKYLKDELQASF